MKSGEDLLNDPIAWGRRLIETEDHDPLYSGLVRWDVDRNRKRRFLIAYWSCYSVGASWHLSRHSGVEFWVKMETAAANVVSPAAAGACELDRWPRAHERRHWRGQKCVDSVRWLREAYPNPEDAVREVEELPSPLTLRGVELAVTRWPQFGPWIAFKAADMMERVMGLPVEFPTAITSLYKDPREGGEMMAPVLGLPNGQVVTEVLLEAYDGMTAPGLHPRTVNVQEVETVLCKWKSARKGKYWIGLDTRDHRDELERWGARDLLAAYPNWTP